MQPSVTVSIVTHLAPADQLLKVIDCVMRSPLVVSIYVVDNSPVDTLRKVVEGLQKVIYTTVPNNGYGAGHNTAIRKAIENGADYHLVINSDLWWINDVITPLVRFMEMHRSVGMVMPKVYYPDGDLQLTARRLPTPYDVFAKRFLPGWMARKRIERYLLADTDHNRIINSPYLLGSFMLIRCKALREVGLFDERFFMYPEDIDLTRRIHEKFETLYYPEVSIVHEHKAESRKSLKMLRIHIFNMIKYFNKWGWFIDRQRRNANRHLERNIKRLPREEWPSQRG